MVLDSSTLHDIGFSGAAPGLHHPLAAVPAWRTKLQESLSVVQQSLCQMLLIKHMFSWAPYTRAFPRGTSHVQQLCWDRLLVP